MIKQAQMNTFTGLDPIFIILVILVVLGAVWAIRSRAGRWALGLGIPIIALFLFASFFGLRVESFRQAAVQPNLQFHAVNGFEDWQKTQMVQAEKPPKAWVLAANSGGFVITTIGNFSIGLPHPGPRGEIVGYSGLEPLQEEALAKADGKRRDQLQGLILEAAGQRNPGGLSESSIQEARNLADRILLDGSCEKDSWVDAVKLPASGETMYRAATLARVPQERIQESGMELLNSLETARRESWTERQRLGWTIFSAGILALVVFLIYSFLNAGTKGHMAWPLRIVSLMAFLILCFGLLILRRHLP